MRQSDRLHTPQIVMELLLCNVETQRAVSLLRCTGRLCGTPFSQSYNYLKRAARIRHFEVQRLRIDSHHPRGLLPNHVCKQTSSTTMPNYITTRLLGWATLALLVGLISGCDTLIGSGGAGDADGPLIPSDTASVSINELDVHLVTPDTVSVGEAFEIRILVQNQTRRDVVVQTGSGCLTVPGVFEIGGERVPFRGTGIFCTAAITNHDIPSGETIERTFDVQATLRTEEEDVPASPGTYEVRTELDWGIQGDHSSRTLQRRLRVQP